MNTHTFRIILLLLVFISVMTPHVSANKKDVETIRKRFITELMEPKVDDAKVEALLNTFKTDSVWPGIDYADVSNTGFQHRTHLDNMLYLSRAYKHPDSKHRKSKKVKKTFDKALGFWIANDFICENWWWNQIGTPNALISILLIMDTDLSAKQVKDILPIVGRANMDASGARPSGDRIKIAGLLAKTAVFNRDIKLIDDIMPLIEGEIKFANGARGLQYDFSFHHREDRVNNTNSYGLSYASTFAEWAEHVAGTKYAFSAKSINLLVDFYLDGVCKQMVYGKVSDTGIMNRDISRPGHSSPSPAIPLKLMKVTDYRRDELADIAAIRSGEDVAIHSFSKFFWESEHFVFQRPDFYTSVRMYSTRNANMEVPYNGEGLTNHYRGDGSNYLSLTGEEYNGLPPVYDWMKIPGTTIMQSEEMPPETEIQKRGLTDFVGGLSNGLYGAAVFDFKSPHNPLSAKKAWFFFDKEYICLGARLNSSTSRPVVTTLNQCRLEGDFAVSDGGKQFIAEQGSHLLKDAGWVYHGNTGYIFPVRQAVNISIEQATGNWHKINRQTDSSKETVRENVFKLWIDQGSRLDNAIYEYVVMPAATIEEVKKYGSSPRIVTISNTPGIQAVWHKDLNMGYIVFYKSGTIGLTENITLSADSQAMLLVCCDGMGKIKEITVSDPSRKQGRLHLRVNQSLESDNKECRTSWNNTDRESSLEIQLPRNGYEGKSVTVLFK